MQSFRPPGHIIQHKCWESRQKAPSPQLPNIFLSLDACWWTQTTLVTRLEAEEFALKQLVQNLQVKMWGKWARIAYQALLHLPCTGIRYISPSDAFWTLCPCDRGYETSLKHIISAHLLRYLAPPGKYCHNVPFLHRFISWIFKSVHQFDFPQAMFTPTSAVKEWLLQLIAQQVCSSRMLLGPIRAMWDVMSFQCHYRLTVVFPKSLRISLFFCFFFRLHSVCKMCAFLLHVLQPGSNWLLRCRAGRREGETTPAFWGAAERGKVWPGNLWSMQACTLWTYIDSWVIHI